MIASGSAEGRKEGERRRSDCWEWCGAVGTARSEAPEPMDVWDCGKGHIEHVNGQTETIAFHSKDFL
jgi:hypothetical protein